MALLELNDVHTYYGAIARLRGVTLNVEEGEIVTLIGSNGAGKSTTLRTISGQLRPRQGEITLRGKRIDDKPPHEIVEMGVCQSPEGRRVFRRMSVLENLEMGAFSARDKASISADFERVYGLLPTAQGTRDPEGRDDVRRRAADAGHRPRADGRAQGPAPGRAVDGPRTDPGRAESSRSSRRSTSRDDGPPCRAERPDGAGDRQPRVCPPDRRDRPRRRGLGAGQEPGRPEPAYLGGD